MPYSSSEITGDMSALSRFMLQTAHETYPEARTEGHDYITEQMASKVVALISPGCNALDVGCGQGPALEWFTKHGFFVTGIALNDEDIRACRDKGFRVFHCDQNQMPEAWTGAYSLVWARHVLEHSIAPYFTLIEFARVLKAGGILYLEMPAPDTACCHEANQNHYSVLGQRAWASLITRSGFEVLESLTIKMGTPVGPDQYFAFICRKA